MAYLGHEQAGPALGSALTDEHWRVRMNSASALGRLRVAGATVPLRRAQRDPHSRVRQAAVLALQRVGDESAIGDLARLLPQSDDAGARRIETAMDQIDRRM
jgi:HEAT repeat protein